jgi:PKD repeat protein
MTLTKTESRKKYGSSRSMDHRAAPDWIVLGHWRAWQIAGVLLGCLLLLGQPASAVLSTDLYPYLNGGTDGDARVNSANQSIPGIFTMAGTGAGTSSTTISTFLQGQSTSGNYNISYRATMMLQPNSSNVTNGIPKEATVSAVELHFYQVSAKSTGLGDLDYTLTKSYVYSNTTVSAADYNYVNLTNTTLSDYFTPRSSAGNVTIYGNAAMVALFQEAVTKGGQVNMTVRSRPDVDLSSSCVTWSAGGISSVQIRSNRYSDLSQRWFLRIYYTLPATPVASYSASTTAGDAPLTVTFTDTSTNTPTAWAWDFGDGNTSTDQNPAHTFRQGNWQVILNASNSYGSSISPVTWINVTRPAIVLYDVNYMALGYIPASTDLIVNGNGDYAKPINATMWYNTADRGGALNTRWDYDHQVGSLTVMGLTPSGNTRLSVNLSINQTAAGTRMYLMWGDVDVRLYRNGDNYYVMAESLGSGGTTTQSFTYDSTSTSGILPLQINRNVTNQSYTTSAGAGTATVKTFYGGEMPYAPISGSNAVFLTDGGAAATETNLTISLYRIIQTVPATGNVTVIGDPKLVPFGIDGPHEIQTWINSSYMVESVGGTYTVWVDPQYVYGNATMITLIKSMVVKGYDIGIHYTVKLTEMTVTDAEAEMISETENVTNMIGTAPTSFCALGNKDNITYAQFAYTRLNQTWRNGYSAGNELAVPPTWRDWNWNWTRNASAAGGLAPAYTHETDLEPEALGAGGAAISRSKFEAIVNNYANNTMHIIGFGVWYNIQRNTNDSTLTENALKPGDLANFTAHTNGYPALVEVNVAYSSSLRAANISGGANPSIRQAPDGNVEFYVADGMTYAVGQNDLIAQFTSSGGPVVWWPNGQAFTDTSTGSPTAWDWQFNDVPGNNTWISFNSTQNASLVSPGIGNYSIRLNASNLYGSNTSTQITWINVSVAPTPTASFTANQTQGYSPLAVLFNDTTTNTPTSWIWNFTNVAGNNTPATFSTIQNVTYTFPNGNYSISLNATNAYGSNVSTQVTFINVSYGPPVAAFTTNTTSGMAPLAVLLTDTSTNAPTSNVWAANNVTGNGSWIPLGSGSPLVLSLGRGNWSINETASNAAGSNISTQLTYINVTAPPSPVANFTGTPTSGTAPLTVIFTDSSTNTPTSWAWVFGDGSSTNATLQNPVHAFASTGNYTVNLTASNAGGSNTTSKTGYINVTAPSSTSGFTQQDIWMDGLYTLTFHVTDASTGAPISIVTISDSNGATTTTSGGTGYLTEPAGTVSVCFVVSSGYTNICTSYIVDSDAEYDVQLSAATTVNSYAVTYPPLNIQFHLQTLLGTSIPGARVTAVPSQTTLSNYSYVAGLFGYVLSDVPLDTLAMNGTTDTNGNINFAMMADTQYAMTFTASGYTFNNITITPSSSATYYLITPTNAVNVFQANGTSPQASVAFTTSNTRYNLTTALINLSYTDSSSATLSGTYRIYFTNKTLGYAYNNFSEETVLVSGTFTGSVFNASYYFIDGATAACPHSNGTILLLSGTLVACTNQTNIVNDQSYMAEATGSTASGSVVVNNVIILNNLTAPVGPFGYDILLFFALLFLFITVMAGGAADLPLGSLFAGTFEWFVFEGIGWLHSIDTPITQLGGMNAPIAVGTIAFFCCVIWAIAEFRRRNK